MAPTKVEFVIRLHTFLLHVFVISLMNLMGITAFGQTSSESISEYSEYSESPINLFWQVVLLDSTYTLCDVNSSKAVNYFNMPELNTKIKRIYKLPRHVSLEVLWQPNLDTNRYSEPRLMYWSQLGYSKGQKQYLYFIQKGILSKFSVLNKRTMKLKVFIDYSDVSTESEIHKWPTSYYYRRSGEIKKKFVHINENGVWKTIRMD